jgi:hypothetical protein
MQKSAYMNLQNAFYTVNGEKVNGQISMHKFNKREIKPEKD